MSRAVKVVRKDQLEQLLLGRFLSNEPEETTRVRAIAPSIPVDWFFLDKHREIFCSIKTVVELGDPVNLVTVASVMVGRMGGVRFLQEIGASYLAWLVDYYQGFITEIGASRGAATGPRAFPTQEGRHDRQHQHAPRRA